MRPLALLAPLIIAAISAPADAAFFPFLVSETQVGSIYEYQYALQPNVAFAAGEKLDIYGVDPNAAVSTPYPAFFAITETTYTDFLSGRPAGEVVFSAIRSGISGSGYVFEIDSIFSVPTPVAIATGNPGNTTPDVIYVPGFAGNGPTPEPASLAMLAGGLAIVGAARRIYPRSVRG